VDIVNLTEAINVLISEKCLRNRKDRQRERGAGVRRRRKKKKKRRRMSITSNLITIGSQSFR